MIHKETHPLAGQTVKLAGKTFNGSEVRIEDWWDRVYGKSWMDSEGNPAALNYAFRAGSDGLPLGDDVVYGKIGGLGHLIHVSEIVQPT